METHINIQIQTHLSLRPLLVLVEPKEYTFGVSCTPVISQTCKGRKKLLLTEFEAEHAMVTVHNVDIEILNKLVNL